MRVLLVLEAAGAGVGRHVLDLARGLLQRGHDVHIAWSPVRAEAAFIAGLNEAGLSGDPIDMHRGPGLGDARAVALLRRLLCRHRFDLVHGHSSKAGALARIACAGSRIPVFYTPHAFVTCDPELAAVTRLAYGAAERILSWLGSRIICVSDEERAHARTLGIAGHRLVVIPNGIAPLPAADRAATRRSLGLSDETVCVGFVGRLSRQKAVERLVGAFATACPAGSPGRLVVVGDGPDRDALAALAAKLGAGDRIDLLGQANGPALMAGFDVFVLPSRYEGFPYVLLEAAARGLPIVTTDVGGAATVVVDGENGWIIPQGGAGPDVTAALARAIGTLVGDGALRSAMGRRSAALAGGLTADAMVERTLGVYREVLARQ